jgi:hypothetical protein
LHLCFTLVKSESHELENEIQLAEIKLSGYNLDYEQKDKKKKKTRLGF